MDSLRTSAGELRGTMNMERRSHSPALSGEFSDDSSQESPKSKIRRGLANTLDIDNCPNKEDLLDEAVKIGNFRPVERLLNEGVRTVFATRTTSSGANFPEDRKVGVIKDICLIYQELFNIIYPCQAEDQEVPDAG